MIDWLSYLGIFGLGSVVTATVQWHFKRLDERQSRARNEKREAYIGLLNAYRKAAIESTHENRMDFAYWKIRCELVGSKKVLSAIEEFQESSGNKSNMKATEKVLVDAIKEDLR